MKKKTQEEYQEWSKEFESSLPDGLKANWKALTESEKGFDLFSGHLRQKEFDRLQNELKTAEKGVLADRQAIANAMGMFAGEVEQVKTWYETEAPKHAKLADAYRAEKARADRAAARLRELGLEDDNPQPHDGGGATVNQAVNDRVEKELEEIKKALAIQSRAYPRIIGDMGVILKEGFKEGYDVDPQAVIELASRKNVDLKAAFQELTADQRAERLEKKQNEAIEKAKEEGRREALSKIHSPERLAPSAPTPADGLFTGAQPPSSTTRVSNAAKAWLETGGSTTGF